MSRCYVYALMDGPAPRVRVAGRTLESLRIGGVYAAVIRTESPPPVSEDALAEQHAAVSRMSARVEAILPMRFGALVEESRLEELIARNQRRLRTALALVRGREQMTVRILGPARPPAPGRTSSRPPSGTEYLRRRREAARTLPLPGIARRVQATVRGLVVAERIATGDGAMHVTMWHLIERGKAREYRRALGGVPGTMPPFQVIVSGPWPPFAFAPELRE